MDKIKAIIKNKSFWGYILTGAGSFLAGSGDLLEFLAGLVNFFN